MPIFDAIETASAAEKIGWLGLGGGLIVACVKVVKFLATFGEEHRLLLEHLKVTTPMVVEVIEMKAATVAAKEERKEMLEEIRGLRSDLTALYAVLIKGNNERA